MKTERWIKENLEAVAIAVVMALVIRQFAIEAFKIPTESMAPTLLGDRLGTTGDRILVDKVVYRVSEPSRGDVIVFKYPLNASKNYIKRLIGLPGETLELRDGDVLIDGKTWRKPHHVQDVLLFEVHPGAEDVQGRRRRASDWEVDENRWKRTDDGGLAVASPDGESLARYGREITDAQVYDSEVTGNNPVGDVRLVVDVTATGGEVVFEITDNLVANVLTLAVGEGRSTLTHGEESWDLEGASLTVGDRVEVRFQNLDDALQVEVDGEEFGPFPYQRADVIDPVDNGIRFGVRSGSARFEEIRIYRDVYYENNGVCDRGDVVVIPEDRFFVLGDNSRNSKDSRLWKIKEYRMIDGTVYKADGDYSDGEHRARPGPRVGTITFMDHLGIWRVLAEGEIQSRPLVDAQFVPRDNLIGKAFFVFWPLNPLSGQFRVKFIR